jgi:transposase
MVLHGQDLAGADELDRLLGLGPIAQDLVTGWAMHGKGRALWCIGEQLYKVQTVLDLAEQPITYTNQAIEVASWGEVCRTSSFENAVEVRKTDRSVRVDRLRCPRPLRARWTSLGREEAGDESAVGILAGEMSIAEVARKEKVSEQSIGRWKAEFIEAGRTALVAGRSGPSSREEQLEAEVVELTQALGEAHVELRVWKKSAEGRLGPSRTSR